MKNLRSSTTRISPSKVLASGSAFERPLVQHPKPTKKNLPSVPRVQVPQGPLTARARHEAKSASYWGDYHAEPLQDDGWRESVSTAFVDPTQSPVEFRDHRYPLDYSGLFKARNQGAFPTPRQFNTHLVVSEGLYTSIDENVKVSLQNVHTDSHLARPAVSSDVFSNGSVPVSPRSNLAPLSTRWDTGVQSRPSVSARQHYRRQQVEYPTPLEARQGPSSQARPEDYHNSHRKGDELHEVSTSSVKPERLPLHKRFKRYFKSRFSTKLVTEADPVPVEKQPFTQPPVKPPTQEPPHPRPAPSPETVRSPVRNHPQVWGATAPSPSQHTANQVWSPRASSKRFSAVRPFFLFA